MLLPRVVAVGLAAALAAAVALLSVDVAAAARAAAAAAIAGVVVVVCEPRVAVLGTFSTETCGLGGGMVAAASIVVLVRRGVAGAPGAL